jgi:hypothetical protein
MLENDRCWGLYKIGFAQGLQIVNYGFGIMITLGNDRSRFHCVCYVLSFKGQAFRLRVVRR